MPRLRDEFGQKYFRFETKTWRQKQVFESFGKVQASTVDIVKLFMVFFFMFSFNSMYNL